MISVKHYQKKNNAGANESSIIVSHFNRHKSRHQSILDKTKSVRVRAQDNAFILEFDRTNPSSVHRRLVVYLSEAYISELCGTLTSLSNQAVDKIRVAAKKDLDVFGGCYSSQLKFDKRDGFGYTKLDPLEDGTYILAATANVSKDGKVEGVYTPILQLELLP